MSAAPQTLPCPPLRPDAHARGPSALRQAARQPAFGGMQRGLRIAGALFAALARRRRVRRDYDDLALMSERELLDIGLPRSSVREAAERAWTRDWPC